MEIFFKNIKLICQVLSIIGARGEGVTGEGALIRATCVFNVIYSLIYKVFIMCINLYIAYS